MELIKKNIHMNKIKCNSLMQMTLEDDFNVPDIKPDVEKIIKASAHIILNDYKLSNQKLSVDGTMEFNVLYISSEDGRLVHCIKGKVPFQDVVNMENSSSEDMIKINTTIDDLSVIMVNSRKISIRSIISFECIAENIADVETVVDVEDTDREDVHCLRRDINVTQIAVNKKDICRVKEEIILPSSKQNVLEILYADVTPQAMDTRLSDGGINLKGELLVFIMYASENGDTEYIEKEIPFSSFLEVDGCRTDMIDDIRYSLSSRDVSVKADNDGEERIIDLDVVIALDIKLYHEENISIVNDFYSTSRKLKPTVFPGYYDNVQLKNNSKARITDRIKVDEKEPAVMQLCNSNAVIKIDSSVIEKDGIKVEGVVDVTLMYVTNDDSMPVNSISGVIPFSHLIEVPQISQESIFSIRPGIEHCSVMMTDSREFEVKAVIMLDTIVFKRTKEEIIEGYDCEDLTDDDILNMPSMIGYVVKENDSLWELAKRYRTTIDAIKKMNFLESDEIQKGDRLLIVT